MIIHFTFAQLRSSMLVQPSLVNAETWDTGWRSTLVDNLEILVGQLWQIGIDEIFVDGSFVEDKDHPIDIDGYFVCDVQRLASGDLARDLNKLDPFKIWTWDPKSRRASANSAKKQLPMWHRYKVELYPHYGQPSGIRDEFGNQQQFPAAFRKSRRAHKPKGIIKLVKGVN